MTIHHPFPEKKNIDKVIKFFRRIVICYLQLFRQTVPRKYSKWYVLLSIDQHLVVNISAV